MEASTSSAGLQQNTKLIDLRTIPVFAALKREDNTVPDRILFFSFVAGYKTFSAMRLIKENLGNLRVFNADKVQKFLLIIDLDERTRAEIERNK